MGLDCSGEEEGSRENPWIPEEGGDGGGDAGLKDKKNKRKKV